MTTSFLLEQGPLVGTIQDYPPESSSVALFCPDCGLVWGRIIHYGTHDSYAQHKKCEKHGDGSFFSPIDALETFNLPDDLACYEARVSLLHMENYNQYTRWSIDGYRV